MSAKLGGARAVLRQQRRGGKIERLGDRAQHADRRIAGAALDLRQIPLRGFRGLRQLPAGHAALGAVLSHFAPDGGEKSGRMRPFARRGGDSLFAPACFGRGAPPRQVSDALPFMHYSACTYNATPSVTVGKRSGATQGLLLPWRHLFEHLPPAAVLRLARRFAVFDSRHQAPDRRARAPAGSPLPASARPAPRDGEQAPAGAHGAACSFRFLPSVGLLSVLQFASRRRRPADPWRRKLPARSPARCLRSRSAARAIRTHRADRSVTPAASDRRRDPRPSMPDRVRH